MRAITLCPNCQTQFFVSDAQLEKQKGKVRCGQCLHVFLATEHFISSMRDENDHADSENADVPMPNTTSAVISNIEETIAQETSIDEVDSDASPSNDENFQPLSNPSSSEELISTDFTAAPETESTQPANSKSESNALLTELHTAKHLAASETTDLVGDYVPGGGAKKVKPTKPFFRKSKYVKLFAFVLLLLLVLLAIVQTVYFSRSTLATFYPKTKPYLLQMCVQLKCSISLPAQIEYVVIDDSDIQEDADYVDLMRFSSTLLNRAPFAQQFPNLELTLTDIEDEPKLRRIFKPQEYLPASINIADGMAPGREFKIKLAMQAKNTVVSGYRVSINY